MLNVEYLSGYICHKLKKLKSQCCDQSFRGLDVNMGQPPKWRWAKEAINNSDSTII